MQQRRNWVILSVAVIAVLAAGSWWWGAVRSPAARQQACLAHAKMLAVAMQCYVSTWDEYLPPADWCDRLRLVPREKFGRPEDPLLTDLDVFRCPEAPGERCSFAYNRQLAGLNLEKVADAGTVLLIESDGGWNALAGPVDRPPRRHPKGVVVAFASGHARVVPWEAVRMLNWDPHRQVRGPAEAGPRNRR